MQPDARPAPARPDRAHRDRDRGPRDPGRVADRDAAAGRRGRGDRPPVAIDRALADARRDPPDADARHNRPSRHPRPAATPVLVPAPLTGLLVGPRGGRAPPDRGDGRRPRADARPQSGFNSASIVWQAPAEGGIPRYMMIFQDQVPNGVGPVRSSREYYIEWAAEWRAMYVHAGGSPQALETLARQGARPVGLQRRRVPLGRRPLPVARPPTGSRRTTCTRTGEHLRALANAARRGRRAARAGLDVRARRGRAPCGPGGGTITVDYPTRSITYRYDPATNTLPPVHQRLEEAAGRPRRRQGRGAEERRRSCACRFGPLNDGHPQKHRLEAQDVGKGVAYIATNGLTIKGQWRKASPTAPTLLFGRDGKPVIADRGPDVRAGHALGYTVRDPRRRRRRRRYPDRTAPRAPS